MNMSGIFTVQKAKRGSEILNPENLKLMDISGIFTVKKTKRGSEFLNPENLKSMNISGSTIGLHNSILIKSYT